MSKPASPWTSAFPADDPDEPYHGLPPARPRTRTVPIDETLGSGNQAEPSEREVALPEEADQLGPQTETETDLEGDPKEEKPGNSGSPFEVGYSKPPRHTQFKPGQSGNPKGRPKGAKGLNTIVRETLGSKIAIRTADGSRCMTRIEALILKLCEQAAKGNVRAQIELVKLWKIAVPDETTTISGNDGESNDLTAADLAAIEEYRQWLGPQGGDNP
ncbi:DUF5681 domain-containing protein [Erythrobacter sp.]|uniref:DUF5681 domain-containing protein n=1 Tax=Erythrobacter sp. TaxID=1042 RepID=UPI003C754D81